MSDYALNRVLYERAREHKIGRGDRPPTRWPSYDLTSEDGRPAASPDALAGSAPTPTSSAGVPEPHAL